MKKTTTKTKTVKKAVKKAAVKAPAKKAAMKKPSRKAPAAKPVAAPAQDGKASAPGTHRARVRMYRVGLGDCFLVTSYVSPKPAHMLIDCGMFAGSRLDRKSVEKDVQAQVVSDIARETGGLLDVVAVTHEHMDHVSIFNSAKDVFDKELKFGEAWFGWVEDPNNKLAQTLRTKYERLQVALASGLTELRGLAASDPDGYADIHRGVTALAGFMGFGADDGGEGELGADGDLGAAKKVAAQPRKAMEYVKQKAGKANLRFGSPGDTWEFGGMKVHVLGPPTSEDQMRIMEKAGASYDRALLFGVDADAPDGQVAPQYPFAPQWSLHVAVEKGQARLLAPQDNPALADMLARYNDAEQSWRQIDNLALDSVSTLALQMDKYINNTSLCLAFEFPNGDVMIFPGDAQVGNWSSWFDLKKFDASDLLARTIFYKVGHHGSHNATYKPALEKMNHPKLVAMIPTNARFAKKSKKWTMPAPKLNQALLDHTRKRLLRNDQGIGEVADPLADKAVQWDGLRANVAEDALYIDYYV